MQIDIVNIEGKKVGELALADAVFGAKVKDYLLWELVKAQQAAKRAGTHATKTRAFVRGGGKKPYKQKGTGNARQGSTRSPQFVGGGKVWGPQPRSYAYTVPKKVKRAALASALSLRVKEKKLVIPGLVLENGSGLSRSERLTAGGLAQLLASADRSPVREEFASSLAVAAMDGTVQRRFQNGSVAGQALLKTGSLEGVRALAGYVIDADARRFIVVAIINHANAARGAAALDYLVQWVYREAGHWDPALHR